MFAGAPGLIPTISPLPALSAAMTFPGSDLGELLREAEAFVFMTSA
jgi:hypothetical protein